MTICIYSSPCLRLIFFSVFPTCSLRLHFSCLLFPFWCFFICPTCPAFLSLSFFLSFAVTIVARHMSLIFISAFKFAFICYSSAGIFLQSMEARKRVSTELSYRTASQARLAGRYENPIPTRFLSSINCSKIPALFAPLSVLSSLSLCPPAEIPSQRLSFCLCSMSYHISAMSFLLP